VFRANVTLVRLERANVTLGPNDVPRERDVRAAAGGGLLIM